MRFPHLFAENQPLLEIFERMRFLKGVPLFSELAAEDLRELSEVVASQTVAAGEFVFRKGDVGEDLYVVRAGQLQAKIGAQVIESFDSLDFFGELSVVDREPRSADVIAVSNALLLRLSRENLESLMARRPQIVEQFLLVMVRRVRKMNQRLTLQRVR
jgi:CRP-like cAMP-binding protein